MSSQELLELKGWGHQLLKLLAEKRGETLDQTYSYLASRLGIRKRKAHFGTMDAKETERAVKMLRKCLKERPRDPNSKKSKERAMRKELEKMSKMKLPQSELRAALAKIAPKRKVTTWEKILLYIFSRNVKS